MPRQAWPGACDLSFLFALGSNKNALVSSGVGHRTERTAISAPTVGEKKITPVTRAPRTLGGVRETMSLGLICNCRDLLPIVEATLGSLVAEHCEIVHSSNLITGG